MSEIMDHLPWGPGREVAVVDRWLLVQAKGL